jgi:hypothetical protein
LLPPIGGHRRCPTTVWLCFIVVPRAFGKILPKTIFHPSSRALHFFGVCFRGIASVGVI